jgi:nitronate monooxygenase
MFLVSGPDLLIAACQAGIIGSFPAPNARTTEILDQWLAHITTALAPSPHLPISASPLRRVAPSPWAINLVVHRTYQRQQAELELVLKYKPALVITALGSPRAVVEAIHSYGGLVFADVNSVMYARKAAEVGVDGLILVSAGAGGHTGQVSPIAFVEEVRRFWDGYVVLAGAISCGRAIRAAQTLGADLAYMGTRFIATQESQASHDYRQMLVESSLEDIVLSAAITGIPANFLKPSLRQAGYDPDKMTQSAAVNFDNPHGDAKAWRDIWSAGQGVGSIQRVQTVAELVADLQAEYRDAIRREREEDSWTKQYQPSA